jgi:hypothetical protein
VTDDTSNSPPERRQSAEAPGPGSGASPSENVNIDESSLTELAKESIKTEDRKDERKEWTRRALIVGFFVSFLAVFGVAAYAALQSSEPFNNVMKVVAYFAPIVTGLGGYIWGHYFNPPQNSPQDPGGGASGQ